MLRIKKNQSNYKELIEYSLLVFGYVIIDDFFSESDDLFKSLKSKHLKDLSLNNLDPEDNYFGGVCKTFIDLLEKKETKKNFKSSTKKINFEIELKELVTLPFIFETAKQFFHSDNLQIDVFKTLDTPNSKHIAQEPHFDRIPSLKFMLYVNDISIDNGAFELSASTHHWVKKTFPLPRPSFDDLEYFKKTRKLPKPIIDNLKPIEGKAGTLIIFHTDTIHNQGLVNNGQCRIIRSHFRKKDDFFNKKNPIEKLKNVLKNTAKL